MNRFSSPPQTPIPNPEPPRSPLGFPKKRRLKFWTLKRVLSPDGRISLLHSGDYHPLSDLYHMLLTMSWMKFWGILAVLYLVINSVFAIAYLVGDDNIANARPGSLSDSFFFSVQTMATIGYGAMYPKTLYANILVAIEAFVGLLSVALATGLMFARVSRPTARVLISKVAVIMPYNGVPTLMFRAANQRANQILEARLWVTLIRDEVTTEGHTFRRIYDMKLVRNHSPFFNLTWTGLHPIDEDSPLYGETPETMAESHANILISLTGIDETVSQTVHARYTYAVRQILWDHRFVDILAIAPNGQRLIDYTHFHETIPLSDGWQ